MRLTWPMTRLVLWCRQSKRLLCYDVTAAFGSEDAVYRFKGGTSLSKCHKVIRRFSEDIDITIDTLLSQGQKKR